MVTDVKGRAAQKVRAKVRRTEVRPIKPKGPEVRRTKLLRDVLARHTSFAALYGIDPMERVQIVKEGLPAALLTVVADDMSIPKELLYATIGVARATVDRKIREQTLLSQDESERVMGIAKLVNQVDAIVHGSGNPEGFDAAKWVSAWLTRPQAPLGGKRPAELMDTAEGRGIVSGLIAQMQSGAYA